MYSSYGAKGIEVCEEWRDRENFRKWCKDNGWSKDLRLNRIDSTKDYSPENCCLGRKNAKTGKHLSKKQREQNRIARLRRKENAGIQGYINDDEMYARYHSMHERCENVNREHYKNYGGRGIRVCEEWSGEDGFINFKKWTIESGYEKGLTLDRIDNDKGYSPENCRWLTVHEQNENKRNRIKVTINGENKLLSDVARDNGMSYSKLYSRLVNGMEIMEALSS